MAGVLASEVVVKAIPCPRPSSGEEASTSSSTAKECVAEQEKSSSCFESVGAKASQQLFDRKSGYDSFEAQCGNTPDGVLSGATIVRLVLKPFEHQVAGHRFEEGKQGSLVDGEGRFYKPLQTGHRGKKELAFYQSVQEKMGNAKEGDLNASFLRSFVPDFFGTVNLNIENVGTLTHLVLSDVTLPYRRPSIMDVKVGHQTWYDGASPEYIEKCKVKDESSTSSALGFKVCGLQVFNGTSDDYWRPGKQWSKCLDVERVRDVIRRFCGRGPKSTMCAKRKTVLMDQILEQLRSIRHWFENQRSYHFYSASLLVLYEGMDTDEQGELIDPGVKVYIIDFAHTFRPKNKEHDENFIEGLKCFESELLELAKSETAPPA